MNPLNYLDPKYWENQRLDAKHFGKPTAKYRIVPVIESIVCGVGGAAAIFYYGIKNFDRETLALFVPMAGSFGIVGGGSIPGFRAIAAYGADDKELKRVPEDTLIVYHSIPQKFIQDNEKVIEGLRPNALGIARRHRCEAEIVPVRMKDYQKEWSKDLNPEIDDLGNTKGLIIRGSNRKRLVETYNDILRIYGQEEFPYRGSVEVLGKSPISLNLRRADIFVPSI